jgi:hypothetical protein
MDVKLRLLHIVLNALEDWMHNRVFGSKEKEIRKIWWKLHSDNT